VLRSEIRGALIALMKEAVSTSESRYSFYENKRRNIPNESHLQGYGYLILNIRCEAADLIFPLLTVIVPFPCPILSIYIAGYRPASVWLCKDLCFSRRNTKYMLNSGCSFAVKGFCSKYNGL
jgi:hypothetical protein